MGRARSLRTLEVTATSVPVVGASDAESAVITALQRTTTEAVAETVPATTPALSVAPATVAVSTV